MFSYKTILILIIASVPDWCFSQYSSDIDSLKKILEQKGQAEVVIRDPGRRELERLTRYVSVKTVRDNEVRIKLSPGEGEWFLNQNIGFRITGRPEIKGFNTPRSVAEAMEWDSYPSYDQYIAIMEYYSEAYPDLCVLDTIGTSVDGRLVLVLKISDNCKKDEAEPEVFYSSTMHGDETGGFILMLRLTEYLLEHYDSDSRIRNLIDNLEIWINPLANPDGTYRDGNYIESPVRYNANGIDLNRNFPDPENPEVIQQKETLDMMRFLAERRFALSANFHSGEEVVNYPWDRWPAYHADNSWYYGISRAWADTVHIYSRPGYMTFKDNGVTIGYVWYPLYGGRQDYVTYELSGREVTVELDKSDITPPEDLPFLWEYNYRSMINYLENALYGIHGNIEDSFSGEPVAARIFIQRHDKDNSHVYSDTLSGNFTRFLQPGSYNLTISAGGYNDLLVTDVIVKSGEATKLNIKLQPVFNEADTIPRDKPLIYPNPATDHIRIIVPESMKGQLVVSIFSFTGILVTEFNTETVSGFPLYYRSEMLKPGNYIVIIRNLTTGISGQARFVILR